MRKVALYRGITSPFIGDAYTFVGIERNTKLVLAWHLGDRDVQSTEAFTEKLRSRNVWTLSIDDRWLSTVPASCVLLAWRSRRLRAVNQGLSGHPRRRAEVFATRSGGDNYNGKNWQSRPEKNMHINR